MRGPKSARSRRSRAAFAGGGAHGGIGPGPFPMLPPGAAAGFWDSTTPPPKRNMSEATSGSRIRWKLTLFRGMHHERIIRPVGRELGRGWEG